MYNLPRRRTGALIYQDGPPHLLPHDVKSGCDKLRFVIT